RIGADILAGDVIHIVPRIGAFPRQRARGGADDQSEGNGSLGEHGRLLWKGSLTPCRCAPAFSALPCVKGISRVYRYLRRNGIAQARKSPPNNDFWHHACWRAGMLWSRDWSICERREALRRGMPSLLRRLQQLRRLLHDRLRRRIGSRKQPLDLGRVQRLDLELQLLGFRHELRILHGEIEGV